MKLVFLGDQRNQAVDLWIKKRLTKLAHERISEFKSREHRKDCGPCHRRLWVQGQESSAPFVAIKGLNIQQYLPSPW